MATISEAVNSIGAALKQAMKRIEQLEREVEALKSRTVGALPPAIDPILTTEEDGEFEEVG